MYLSLLYQLSTPEPVSQDIAILPRFLSRDNDYSDNTTPRSRIAT